MPAAPRTVPLVAAAATDRLTRPAWVVAAAAATSVLAHTWMLAVHAHGVVFTGLMAAMTLWCGWCAFKAARHPTVHCLHRLLLMSLAMVAVYAAMLIAPSGAASTGHAHHHSYDAAALTAASKAEDHAAATLAIIGVEYLVAVVCVVSLRRRRPSQTLIRISEASNPIQQRKDHDCSHC